MRTTPRRRPLRHWLRIGPDVYRVETAHGTTYHVRRVRDADGTRYVCTCPAGTFGRPCYHAREMAALFQREEELLAARAALAERIGAADACPCAFEIQTATHMPGCRYDKRREKTS